MKKVQFSRIYFFICFLQMTENPWDVDSIQAFSFLKCPECIFDTKEEEIFQEHAVENHPLSFVLFGKADLKEEDEDFYENLALHVSH